MRDDEDRPRRRSREGEEDGERQLRRNSRQQSSTAWVLWLVGGIVGVVFLLPLLCCGGCALLGTINNNAPPLAQNNNNPPPPAFPLDPVPPQNPAPRGGDPLPIPPGPPKPVEPKVVAISPKQLGQELFDGTGDPFGRYVTCLLQLEGVVREQSKGPDGSITEVVFLEPVVARKTSAMKEYRIWCRFSTPVPPGGETASRVAVGETVTIRGKMTGAGVGSRDPQATLNECVLVGEGAGGKPGRGPANPPPPLTKPAPALVRWQVKPDPLPADLTLPAKAKGKIPMTGYPITPNNVVDKVVFPTSPSPFVTVAVKGRKVDAHEVWDLRTMKRVGGPIEPEHPYTQAFLSPDGAYFAVPTFGIPSSPGIEVYAVADGQHYPIKVTNDINRSCQNADFAGPGQAVTLIHGPDKAGGADILVQVWDIKTRKEVRRFEAAAPLDRKLQAFGPGRRYLALPSGKYDRVLLYDLTTAELVGELPPPTGSKTLGLSFSPDGKQLAGLFKVGDTTRLLAWNLDASTGSAHFTLGSEAVPEVTVYQGPVLDWMPDSSGWVVYGRRIVDRQSGAYYWPIPAEDRDWTPRRIFPDARLAYVGNDRGRTSLTIVPLQKEKMEEALKRVRSNR